MFWQNVKDDQRQRCVLVKWTLNSSWQLSLIYMTAPFLNKCCCLLKLPRITSRRSVLSTRDPTAVLLYFANSTLYSTINGTIHTYKHICWTIKLFLSQNPMFHYRFIDPTARNVFVFQAGLQFHIHLILNWSWLSDVHEVAVV